MQHIDILDPNLGDRYPTLVPWVNEMRSAGYSGEQIQMYFREQMRQGAFPASIHAQTQNISAQQLHPQQQQGPIPTSHHAQQQHKLQMARNIVQAYTGRVTLQQVMEMPFERVLGLHNEILSQLNQTSVQNQKPQQLTKLQMAQCIIQAHTGVTMQNVMAMTLEKVRGWYNEVVTQLNHQNAAQQREKRNHEAQAQKPSADKQPMHENSNSHQNIPNVPPRIQEPKQNQNKSAAKNKKQKRLRLEVKEWLKDIGLESNEIFDILLNNGFESLQVVKLMTVADLNAMNIHRIGWKKALLNGIAALNERKKRKIEEIGVELDEIEIMGPDRKKQRIDDENEEIKAKFKELELQNIALQKQLDEVSSQRYEYKMQAMSKQSEIEENRDENDVHIDGNGVKKESDGNCSQNDDVMNQVERGELVKSEETEDDEDNVIEFNINRPPPKTDKTIKIKMKKTQKFGTAYVGLEQRFNKKMTLSFDGEEIANDWTPQKLIDDFEFEEGDLIDARYE